MSYEQEAMWEFASSAGYERPTEAWLLTGYDVWVANPHYQGAPQPHPEMIDEEYEDE